MKVALALAVGALGAFCAYVTGLAQGYGDGARASGQSSPAVAQRVRGCHS